MDASASSRRRLVCLASDTGDCCCWLFVGQREKKEISLLPVSTETFPLSFIFCIVTAAMLLFCTAIFFVISSSIRSGFSQSQCAIYRTMWRQQQQQRLHPFARHYPQEHKEGDGILNLITQL
jgi:hypothetical protein